MFTNFLRVLFILSASHALVFAQDRPFITLHSGLTIDHGAFINPLHYYCFESDWDPIIITGNDFTLDFSRATLWGSEAVSNPDEYKGIAIIIKNAHNVRINNLNIHRFHTAIYIENSDSIFINNCDLSYGFRPKLYSQNQYDHAADRLHFRDNNAQQWSKFGSAIYGTNVKNSTFEAIRITNGFNGILLDQSSDNTIFNSSITFNSGVGIGLYKSSHNIIQHNKIDYHVRGFSGMFYPLGEGSTGIILFEQCNQNSIAFNSITHCGHGIFIWAGQSTMETGEGGSNQNRVHQNNCSFAIFHGIKATFSSNYFSKNKLQDCHSGIWASYAYDSQFLGNTFNDNNIGLSIEHGYNNVIQNNSFFENNYGISLWENKDNFQRSSRAFNKRHSKQNQLIKIQSNTFSNVKLGINVSYGKKFFIQDNQFYDVEQILRSEQVNLWQLTFRNNTMDQKSANSLSRYLLRKNKITESSIINKELTQINQYPQPLENGYNTDYKLYPWEGKSTIIMNEWGPYDFRYPHIHLHSVADSIYTFIINGPTGSQWKISEIKGLKKISKAQGNYADTIQAVRDTDYQQIKILASHSGSYFYKQNGEFVPANDSYSFSFSKLEIKQHWTNVFYNIGSQVKHEQLIFKPNSITRPMVARESKHLNSISGGFSESSNFDPKKVKSIYALSTGQIKIDPGEYKLEYFYTGRSWVYLNEHLIYETQEHELIKPVNISLTINQPNNTIKILRLTGTENSTVNARFVTE